MLLPTKGVAPQRALLAVGAQIVLATGAQPVTVAQAWRRLLTWREEHHHDAPVAFWWFALALDVLFAMGLVDLDSSNELLMFTPRDDAA